MTAKKTRADKPSSATLNISTKKTRTSVIKEIDSEGENQSNRGASRNLKSPNE